MSYPGTFWGKTRGDAFVRKYKKVSYFCYIFQKFCNHAKRLRTYVMQESTHAQERLGTTSLLTFCWLLLWFSSLTNVIDENHFIAWKIKAPFPDDCQRKEENIEQVKDEPNLLKSTESLIRRLHMSLFWCLAYITSTRTPRCLTAVVCINFHTVACSLQKAILWH